MEGRTIDLWVKTWTNSHSLVTTTCMSKRVFQIRVIGKIPLSISKVMVKALMYDFGIRNQSYGRNTCACAINTQIPRIFVFSCHIYIDHLLADQKKILLIIYLLEAALSISNLPAQHHQTRIPLHHNGH